MNNKKSIIIAGGIIGFLSALLVKMGNPGNMGLCIACFIRDTAGALGLHRASVVQYIRPEVIGLVLGAFVISMFNKELKIKGGSSPFTRFVLGFVVMIGALIFLGCPMRMILRLAGGDLNAITGLAGFAVGIYIGIVCLNKGFSLKRTYKLNKSEGLIFPITMIVLLVLLISAPSIILFSKKGPGAAHAIIAVSLVVGIVAGVLGQKTRLCMVGGIRDLILFKDGYLLSGFLGVFVFALLGNLMFNNFHLGFLKQPIAHNDFIWNFTGMVVVGWGSVLLGGCPFRQLILSGEGNIDSVITVLGMFVGSAFCHNFKLASSPKGPTFNGQVATIICIIVLFLISYFNRENFIIKNKNEVKSNGN